MEQTFEKLFDKKVNNIIYQDIFLFITNKLEPKNKEIYLA